MTEVIDLTHLINENITVYPNTLKPQISNYNTIEKDGFAELEITMCTHTGTHIDAPSHILYNKKSLDEFPANKFIGNAIVIDCKEEQEVNLIFLKHFEKQIVKVDFILFYTGWQEKWGSDEYFEEFPTLTTESSKWLTNFKLKGIGFDAISADKVSSSELPNHNILLEKEIILIENLTNLDKLPNQIFKFQCFPLNIEKADGSPVRAIAIID